MCEREEECVHVRGEGGTCGRGEGMVGGVA